MIQKEKPVLCLPLFLKRVCFMSIGVFFLTTYRIVMGSRTLLLSILHVKWRLSWPSRRAEQSRLCKQNNVYREGRCIIEKEVYLRDLFGE